MREERLFIRQSAAVAGEASVRADDAVARGDDADRIPSDRAADSLCRSPAPALFLNRPRDVSVRGRGPVRNLKRFVDDRPGVLYVQRYFMRSPCRSAQFNLSICIMAELIHSRFRKPVEHAPVAEIKVVRNSIERIQRRIEKRMRATARKRRQ
jgi:hypothetical protein